MEPGFFGTEQVTDEDRAYRGSRFSEVRATLFENPYQKVWGVAGRYSTCCKETRRGHKRSLSLVGKLFPTNDPNHGEPLGTANFITQQDIGGDRTDFINDAVLLNAPNTTSWRRGFGVPVLLVE